MNTFLAIQMLADVTAASAPTPASFDFMPLVNLSGVGVVLAWFLWKAEPRMRAVEAAIDRQSDAILILLLEVDRTSTAARIQAEALRDKIKSARRERGEPEGQK